MIDGALAYQHVFPHLELLRPEHSIKLQVQITLYSNFTLVHQLLMQFASILPNKQTTHL